MKLFNFFNRRNSIKKQQILLTGIVVANFIFGILRSNDIKKSNHLNEKTLVQEKIISDKEFIGLDNSGTKSKIIKTGSGNILEFKEELSTTNSNAINKITLVKNSGILPGSDAYTLTVVVATAKNIESLMDKEKVNYSEPGCPFIIVKKLTEDIITEAIQAYASDNAYWLKLYHFAGDIDTTVFNQLQTEHTEYFKELDELDNS